jgi:outer membrane protein TolC
MDMSHNRKWLCLLGLGALSILTGCGPKNYKEDADKRVYDIIDSRWEPEFGSKANYRIGDVAPGPDDIQVDRAIPASGVLTLPHALALAVAYNSSYQSQKEHLYKAALDLRLVEHRYEMQFFSGASALFGDNRQSSDRRPLSGEQMIDRSQANHTNLSPQNPHSQVIQDEANIGFNRLLARGTQVGIGLAAAWTDILAGRGDRGLNSIFSAAISQPLLRGSDRMIVMEKLTQSERDVLYQIRTFNRFRKTFAVDVATQYFRVLEQYDIVRNTQAYYDGLAALRDRVVKLDEVNLVPHMEVGEAQQDVLRARDALIVAQRKYERSLDQLKVTLNLPLGADVQMDVSLLDALKAHGLPAPKLRVDEVVETALTQRLDIANSADATLDAQRAVYVAADKLRTDLRLKANVDVDRRGHGTIWAGPALDLPLDRVPEQHEYRKALITLEERRRDYDDLCSKVQLEVRDAHRKLTETAERYEVADEGLQTAQKRVKTTSVLLPYGRASSRRVLDAQHDLYDAREVATNALVEYAITTLDFYRDAETLQVRPDGMWQAEGLDLPVAQGGPAGTGPEGIR